MARPAVPGPDGGRPPSGPAFPPAATGGAAVPSPAPAAPAHPSPSPGPRTPPRAPSATAGSGETETEKARSGGVRPGFCQSPLSDSNRRPTHYKCVALAS
ncbi:hypothetical protein STXM2123_4640 [Streptomyces sp. F-3]|nr:hypothetical protein STXM2123_4640 [Streptomyces sp. F-3]